MPPERGRARGARSHAGQGSKTKERRQRIWRFVALGLAVAAVAALILTANPAQVGGAVRHFRLVYIAPAIGLSLAFYILQGIRWWTLLRAGGLRIRLRDAVVLTIAGQATALLPLGELTRALLVATVTDSGLGSVVATETVQELLFAGCVLCVAFPAAVSRPPVLIGLLVGLAVISVIVLALTIDGLYRWLHRGVSHTPLLRRITPGADELQRYWNRLLHHPATYRWLWISVVQTGVVVTLFWLIVDAVDPGKLNWLDAALAYAVTQLAGAGSLLPGGLGASELGAAGFLVVLGLPYGSAAAAALLFRLADKGVATPVGAATLLLVRRRYRLSGASLLELRQSGGTDGHTAKGSGSAGRQHAGSRQAR